MSSSWWRQVVEEGCRGITRDQEWLGRTWEIAGVTSCAQHLSVPQFEQPRRLRSMRPSQPLQQPDEWRVQGRRDGATPQCASVSTRLRVLGLLRALLLSCYDVCSESTRTRIPPVLVLSRVRAPEVLVGPSYACSYSALCSSAPQRTFLLSPRRRNRRSTDHPTVMHPSRHISPDLFGASI